MQPVSNKGVESNRSHDTKVSIIWCRSVNHAMRYQSFHYSYINFIYLYMNDYKFSSYLIHLDQKYRHNK